MWVRKGSEIIIDEGEKMRDENGLFEAERGKTGADHRRCWRGREYNGSG